MASYRSHQKEEKENKKIASIVCINESLSDDELRSVLWKLESERDKEAFGLVCKRWLYLRRTKMKKLVVFAPHMLRRLAARFTSVVELEIPYNSYTMVKDSDLGVIADCFRCLRILTMQFCGEITDAGMVKIGRSLSSLQFLDVSYCENLTDNGLSAVAEGCCNLRSLHLICCRVVTNSVLKALSKNCHNLEELEMQGCTNITDSGLKSLVTGCQLIKWLDINNCPKITVVGIGVLFNKCHSLEYLNVSSCPHVTKAGCDKAGLQFPQCCRVNFDPRIN